MEQTAQKIDQLQGMCCKLQDEHSLFYSKSPIDGDFRAVDKTPKSGNSPVCNTSRHSSWTDRTQRAIHPSGNGARGTSLCFCVQHGRGGGNPV
jgi:hypothetical protein